MACVFQSINSEHLRSAGVTQQPSATLSHEHCSIVTLGSRSIAAFWLGIVEILFSDRSRALYRAIDAVDHISVTSSAFIKGYLNGCEVAIPPRPFPILRERRWICKSPIEQIPTRWSIKGGRGEVWHLSSRPLNNVS